MALNVAIGASIAWAGKDTQGQERLWRSAPLGALLALEVMIYLPVGAYLMSRYPDWSLMYLLDAGSLPEALRYGLLALYPCAAIVAFLVARHFLAKQRARVALGLVAGGLLVGAAIAYFGQNAMFSVGTTQSYTAGTARTLSQSSLAYFLALATLAVLISWAASLWRLRLVSVATTRRAEAEAKKPGPRVDHNAQKTMPPKRKAK